MLPHVEIWWGWDVKISRGVTDREIKVVEISKFETEFYCIFQLGLAS